MPGWDDTIFGNLPGPPLPGSPRRPMLPPNTPTPMLPVNPAQVAGGLYDIGADYAGQLGAWLASHPGSTPGTDQGGLARDLTAMMQSPIHGGFNPDTAMHATLAAAPLALAAKTGTTAEEIATGAEAAAPSAPAILSRANPTSDDIAAIKAAAAAGKDAPWPTAQNPMFDTSPEALARNNQVVPQVSYRDQLPRPDPGATLPSKGRAQQIMDAQGPLSDKIASDLQPLTDPDNPFHRLTQFYSTSPVLEQLQKQGVLDPDDAQQFMRDWAGQGAATSPRTTTPRNMRNSNYLLYRLASGDPMPSQAQGWTPAMNEPGFPMMGMHVDRAQQFATGTEDINRNPKPVMFREGWSGNQADVTGDVHNIASTLYNYDQLNPGQLHPSWFQGGEKGPAYQGYKAAGGWPTGQVLPDKTISDTLEGATKQGVYKQTEYGVMTDPYYAAAQKLDVSPAAAQSGGWFNYGPITGLKSPPKILPDLLNDQLEQTSRVLNLAPQKILDWWCKRKIPLAQNTPGTTLNNSAVG